MSLPYFKFFPAEEQGNYRLMTLSHEGLGVWYLLRMIHLWQHQGKIPDDPLYISPLLRLTPDQWKQYRQDFISRGLIQTIDGDITIVEFRDRWERAKEYSEEQADKRRRYLQQQREKKLLKQGKSNAKPTR